MGIAGGAIIGAIVSWWIYNRQKKTAEIQDCTLRQIRDLDASHEKILKKIEDFESRHEVTLHKIENLSNKIDAVIEKQEKTDESKSEAS